MTYSYRADGGMAPRPLPDPLLEVVTALNHNNVKYQGVRNHFDGSLESISPRVVIISVHLKLSTSLRVVIIPKKIEQKLALNQ